MKTAFIGVDYNAPDQDSYNGVVLTIRKYGKKKTTDKDYKFNSGFPPLDLIDAHNLMVTEHKDIVRCSWSSSIDHFIMDGDKYVWYTDPEDGCQWLKASAKYKRTKAYKELKKKIQAEREDCR